MSTFRLRLISRQSFTAYVARGLDTDDGTFLRDDASLGELGLDDIDLGQLVLMTEDLLADGQRLEPSEFSLTMTMSAAYGRYIAAASYIPGV